MIRILIVVVATVALSTANPLRTAPSIRQVPSCGGIVFPEHCSQAFNNFNNRSRQIVNISDSDSDNRFADDLEHFETFLNTVCGGECLGPYLAISECLGAREITAQINCGQQEDGTFCLVKVLQETTLNDGLPVPNCVNFTSTTCSSTCRQSYIETRDRLGCCAATYYANPVSPFTAIGRNFVTCNVQLTNPCTPESGAAQCTISFNFLLLATVILLSAAMI